MNLTEKEIETMAIKEYRNNSNLYGGQRDGFIQGFKQCQEMSEWISVDVLRLNNPWSLLNVMKKLVEASDILLHQKDYDRLGWEDHEHALREGKKIIKTLSQPSPPQTK